MSATDAPTGAWARDLSPRGEVFVTSGLLTAFAGVVLIWPFVPVIHAGPWSLLLVLVLVVVTVTGMIGRSILRRRSSVTRAVATAGAQLLTLVMLLTAMLIPQTGLLGMIPTPATVEAFGALAVQAASEVYNGTAPLEDTLALRGVLAAGFGILLVLVDHLIAQRLALIAGVLVAVVGAVPTIITLGDADVVWFIALAVLMLLLLRHSARRDPRSPQRSSGAIAAGVGVAAVALAVVVTPGLPVSATWSVPGAGVTVDASLRLGDDLRRPNPTQVLSLATSAETAPYLRLATLSRFDGDVWRPDREDTQPLARGFGEAEWDDEMTGTDRITSIRVLGLSSSRLPVPYPAERIVGVSSGWEVMPSNRTVLSAAADASGRDYTVTSAVVQPSFEQITAVRAAGVDEGDDDPAELPPIVAELADEVTAEAPSDYEKLIALQNWFRSEFEYSVDTPVDEGFDGTGADAVATFLEVRSGYCVHFAGAFALMAQSLDMPVRIVVGYLPGSLTEERRGEEFIYSVMSDQLHAWPEVHFEGIGWVPFEPTATLGVPTAFAREAVGGSTGSGSGPTPAPTTAPSSAPTTAPSLSPEEAGGPTGGGTPLQRLDPGPVLAVSVGVIAVLLLPFVVRVIRRSIRVQRARSGDAASAWAELRDTMVDLGMNPSDARSPRMRAADLVTQNHVDADALQVLVAAVEQLSYARTPEPTGDLSVPLLTVLKQVRASSDAPSRWKARFLARSLFAQRPAVSPLTA